MKITTCSSIPELGHAAGQLAAERISGAIATQGFANVILATGASQFATLDTLAKADVDWGKVTMFHLDEYVGLPESHPASFRKYLKERFLTHVNPLAEVVFVNGDGDRLSECARLGRKIADHPIDVCLAGIGENAHLAFNDPMADFDTDEAYLVVDLDDACRYQQLGEGWFDNFNDVPSQAISMSVKQIMKSRTIICSVPDGRKAAAVQTVLKGPLTPMVPASILQFHNDCHLYLDPTSASRL